MLAGIPDKVCSAKRVNLGTTREGRVDSVVEVVDVFGAVEDREQVLVTAGWCGMPDILSQLVGRASQVQHRSVKRIDDRMAKRAGVAVVLSHSSLPGVCREFQAQRPGPWGATIGNYDAMPGSAHG